jgi:hypothetical protein
MTIVYKVRTSEMKLDSKFKHLTKVILFCHVQTKSRLIKNAKDTVKKLFLNAEIFKKLKLKSTNYSKRHSKTAPKRLGSSLPSTNSVQTRIFCEKSNIFPFLRPTVPFFHSIHIWYDMPF